MSGSVNKVTLLGRLGKDPQMAQMPNGDAVAKFSMATSESWKDKQTGQKREETEWHNVKAFGKLAGIAGQYLKKGGQAYIEGRIKTNKYIDKNGVEQAPKEIIASEIKFVGSKNDGEQQQQTQAPVAYQQSAPVGSGLDLDDEVPF